MHFAGRLRRMGTESAFQVRARARLLEARGVDVIHLEMGEPDVPTPPHVVEAAVRAIRDGHTGYAPACGIGPLRAALARHLSVTREIAVDPGHVVVCPGAKPVIFFAFLALVEAGDEVVLPDPGFPIFGSMADATGAVARTYHPGSGRDRRPDLDALERAITDRTRLLILNSPGNPTGTVLEAEELRRIADACRDRDLVVLSDEVYSRILYGGPHRSIASLPGMAGKTILLDGFSKTFGMTGWRLGYAALPGPLVPVFERLLINSVSCAVHFVQHAALAALEGPQDAVETMVRTFDARRRALLEGIRTLPGVACNDPQGAFFAFADVRGTGEACASLQSRLLEEAGVAVVAGRAFGRAGEGFLRLSFTEDIDRIREAFRRMRNLLPG